MYNDCSSSSRGGGGILAETVKILSILFWSYDYEGREQIVHL